VFHVLAHVASGAHLPSSLFDPAYCAFAERHLGSPVTRALGSDIEVIGRLVTDHGALAALQALAWAFHDGEQAARVREKELASLSEGDVADAAWLDALHRGGPAMEVLRAAAELEAPSFARLPPVDSDGEDLTRALAEVAPCAPHLAVLRVATVRSLRLRGRVARGVIWVGAPGREPPLSVEHAAWQACHEATVDEVGVALASGGASERTVEHAALVLLALRASDHGRAAEHARWYATFGGRAPALDAAALPADVRAVVLRLLRSGSSDP